LEGFRRLNTFKAHSDKMRLEALLNRNGFSGLSELGEANQVDALTPLIMGWLEAIGFARMAPANRHEGPP
jgi:hypothetical protein